LSILYTVFYPIRELTVFLKERKVGHTADPWVLAGENRELTLRYPVSAWLEVGGQLFGRTAKREAWTTPPCIDRRLLLYLPRHYLYCYTSNSPVCRDSPLFLNTVGVLGLQRELGIAVGVGVPFVPSFRAASPTIHSSNACRPLLGPLHTRDTHHLSLWLPPRQH
jgi:hypothetical protein